MNYLQIYSNFLKKHIKVSRPMSVVCDASDGVSGIVLKKVFRNHPKIKLVLINGKPNGRFPAHGPNPLSSGALDQCAKRVLKEGADMGAVFDADGDRIFFIDEKGIPLPSFKSAAVLFLNSTPPFVADELVYQSLKLMKIIPQKNLFPAKVGTYFIKNKMGKTKASIAAEYSGHFYFKDFFGADSGLMTLIKMSNLLSKSGDTLSQHVNRLPAFSIISENKPLENDFLDFKNKLKARPLKGVIKMEERDGLSLIFSDSFLNVRASNTEPLLRMTCGAVSKEVCKKIIKKLET